MNTIKKGTNKVFPIFNIWITNAKVSYPDLSFQILDFDVLKKDLEDCIISAAQSIKRKENTGNSYAKAYIYGFFCGYIQGQLNVHWYHEYIYKQSDDFRLLTAISILDRYFKEEDILRIKLSNFYAENYRSQINIENVDERINPESFKDLQITEPGNSNDYIQDVLGCLKINLIKKISKNDTPEFVPELKDFFSQKEVENLLEKF